MITPEQGIEYETNRRSIGHLEDALQALKRAREDLARAQRASDSREDMEALEGLYWGLKDIEMSGRNLLDKAQERRAQLEAKMFA